MQIFFLFFFTVRSWCFCASLLTFIFTLNPNQSQWFPAVAPSTLSCPRGEGWSWASPSVVSLVALRHTAGGGVAQQCSTDLHTVNSPLNQCSVIHKTQACETTRAHTSLRLNNTGLYQHSSSPFEL